MCVCYRMAENEAHNKMSVEAMCTCFAPTLMHTDTDTVSTPPVAG